MAFTPEELGEAARLYTIAQNVVRSKGSPKTPEAAFDDTVEDRETAFYSDELRGVQIVESSYRPEKGDCGLHSTIWVYKLGERVEPSPADLYHAKLPPGELVFERNDELLVCFKRGPWEKRLEEILQEAE